mgnify:FL=1
MKTINVEANLKEFMEDAVTTDDINQAIFIMKDGTLIDGEFDCGIRGDDHNELLDYFDGMTWEELHQQLDIVRLVPETKFALIGKGQELNQAQRDLLNNSDYQIAEY